MEGLAVAVVCFATVGAGVLGWKAWGWTKRLLRRRKAVEVFEEIARPRRPLYLTAEETRVVVQAAGAEYVDLPVILPSGETIWP